MMNFAELLGVNCTYCHNTWTFEEWSESTPQRATDWYGIRMVRDLNANYLGPLASVFPHDQLGPLGPRPPTWVGGIPGCRRWPRSGVGGA
jgi:photosynthetic reaction center cytochrome c subunit